jgi:hypothetical protein
MFYIILCGRILTNFIIFILYTQGASDWLGFGPVAPFVLSIPCLALAALVIALKWEENRGERTMDWGSSCAHGFTTILKSPRILALGAAQVSA